jgi:hypothetical protein
MVPAPAVAVADGVTVTVAVDPDFTLAVLKVTLTPLGAVADSAIGLVNPLLAATATLKVTAWPWKAVSDETLGVTVSVGSVTVNPSLAVAVAAPLVAFTVMAPVPAAADVVVVTVAVALDPGLTLAGLKLTVTPVGAVADSVTALPKPLAAPTATLKVVDWPWNVDTTMTLA